MSGINSGLKRYAVLPCMYDTGDGRTNTVGNVVLAEINYANGAAVSATVGAVADLAAPSAWTSIVDLSGKMEIYLRPHSAASYYYLSFQVGSDEDAGEGARIQILVDGDVVWDQTTVKDAAPRLQGLGVVGGINNYYEIVYPSFECEESFKIQACTKGTLASANTFLRIGAITFFDLE